MVSAAITVKDILRPNLDLRVCSHVTKFNPSPTFGPILLCIMAHSHCRIRTRTRTHILTTFYIGSDLDPDPFPLAFV